VPLPPPADIDIDPWDLVRVDVADHAEALTTSSTGSLLLAPPTDGTPWRPAPIPEIDLVEWTDVTGQNVQGHEAIDALGADAWHAAGWDGSGVKVAIFDVQWYHSELQPHATELEDVETWDCYAHRSCDPPMDNIRPRFGFEMGAHGVACAEVVRDIAPGVELHLVRVNALTTLENALDWAVRHEIDIITMSLSFFNESFYDGSGSVNAAVDRLQGSDTLLVTSAGNYAQEHWTEDFLDTNGNGWHEFKGGEEALPIRYSSGTKRINLVWDDFTNCGDTDLDAIVRDGEGRIIGRAEVVQDPESGTCAPAERISVAAPGGEPVWLSIQRAAGSPNTTFDVMARSGDLLDPMPRGSVTDPGTHPDVLTVGAVRATSRYAMMPPESFSSWGPTAAGLPKPDLAGPDGLSTTIYGPTGFYGTSASTPATAATIALVMSRHPDMTARQAADWLAARAISDRAPGDPPDAALGAGRVRLPPPGAGTSGCGRGLLALPLLMWLPLGALRRRRRA
jgi:hypothetical protein